MFCGHGTATRACTMSVLKEKHSNWGATESGEEQGASGSNRPCLGVSSLYPLLHQGNAGTTGMHHQPSLCCGTLSEQCPQARPGKMHFLYHGELLSGSGLLPLFTDKTVPNMQPYSSLNILKLNFNHRYVSIYYYTYYI